MASIQESDAGIGAAVVRFLYDPGQPLHLVGGALYGRRSSVKTSRDIASQK
jgi:hypothetical protein